MHLYPTFNPRSYSHEKAATTAVFPCGPRPHLDHLLEGRSARVVVAVQAPRPGYLDPPRPLTRRSSPSGAGPWSWPRAEAARDATRRTSEPANAEPERSPPRARHPRRRTCPRAAARSRPGMLGSRWFPRACSAGTTRPTTAGTNSTGKRPGPDARTAPSLTAAVVEKQRHVVDGRVRPWAQIADGVPPAVWYAVSMSISATTMAATWW